jgi:F-type H+-transporting ATPase subunit epsilon
MTASFSVRIATPERDFFSGEVESLVVTTTEGSMGVLAGHVPMLVALETAPVQMKIGGEWREAAVSGGFAEITNDKAVILADTAEWPEEIEVNRAIEAKKRAEERLLAHRSDLEYMHSQVALQRALMRIHVSKHTTAGDGQP